jgi:glycerol-3-phosphate acyltransferase PlsX
LTIAVDAMGGDHAPRVNVEGAVAAAVDFGLDTLLVGKRREIESELHKTAYSGSRVGVVEADEVVLFDEPAITPIRKKRRASIRIAAECVRDGRAKGMFTAGHTGAAMVVAKMIMGVVEGIDRPALAAVLPGLDRKRVLLDVGANVNCRPEHYREFALMGHFFAQEVLGIEKPKIGLMSVGEEEGKGTDVVKESTGATSTSSSRTASRETSSSRSPRASRTSWRRRSNRRSPAAFRRRWAFCFRRTLSVPSRNASTTASTAARRSSA